MLSSPGAPRYWKFGALAITLVACVVLGRVASAQPASLYSLVPLTSSRPA